MARYGNNRIYKIIRVDWDETPSNTFFNDRTAQPITFCKYYESHPYNLCITDKQQPLLVFQMRR